MFRRNTTEVMTGENDRKNIYFINEVFVLSSTDRRRIT